MALRRRFEEEDITPLSTSEQDPRMGNVPMHEEQGEITCIFGRFCLQNRQGYESRTDTLSEAGLQNDYYFCVNRFHCIFLYYIEEKRGTRIRHEEYAFFAFSVSCFWAKTQKHITLSQTAS